MLADETAVRPGRPKGELAMAEIRLRRDLVQIMWAEGQSLLDIALYLDVPVHTVNNDVTWLARRGRIAPRRQRWRRKQ